MGERSVVFWIMSATVTMIQLSSALTIDNQLAVIKNDCYERLAIGQRLHPRDIYEMKHLNTVPDCQQACTKEGDKCKSFSFGISPEGNATCDLSMHLVRETVDLKPIGTVADTDYDLYIKKLGCKLVIEHVQGSTSSIAPSANSIGYNTVEYANPGSSSTSTYKPVYEINAKPLYHDKPSYGGEDIHQVQTLISIRPSLGLKPVVEDQTGYGSSKPSLSGGYPQHNDFRPQYYDSRPDYSLRPEYYSPDRVDYSRPPSSYDGPLEYRPPRPMDYDNRPYARPPSQSHQSGYGMSQPSDYRPFEDDRPLGGYDGNQIYRPQRPMRPIMEDSGYGSRPHYPPFRPVMEDNGYENSRPPPRPINEDAGYNSNSRPPLRPINEDNGYNSRPPRPIIEDSGYTSNSRPPLRPINEDNGYNSRPPLRPIIEDNGYNSNSRPIIEDNRYNSDDRRGHRPSLNQYYQTDRLDNQYNPDRPDYSPYSNSHNGGYGPSYGSQYSNYQPSKLSAIISDYDRLPRPIKTKPLDDDVSSPYGVPNSYHRYPSFNRPVRPAYDARPYEGDLPPFRPSALNHPYHEHSYFRPAPPDYDPGPVRDPYASQKPSYEVLMTKPPSSQEESGYRGNSLEPSKGDVGGKGNGQSEVHGKPVVSYNVGKNGEKFVGIITEIGNDDSKFKEAKTHRKMYK